MVKTNRSLLIYILLSLVTFGIYSIIFWYKLTGDINKVCKGYGTDSINYLLVFLLGMVTFGIYPIIWLYQQANRIQLAGTKYGLTIQENGTTILLWNLLGILLFGIGPFIGLYLIIKNMNLLGARYNASYESEVPVSQEIRENATISMIQEPAPLPFLGSITGMQGMFQGFTFPMEKGEEIVIGRDPAQSHIVLEANTQDIGRRHCSIRFNQSQNCYEVTNYSKSRTLLAGKGALESGVCTKAERKGLLILGEGGNIFQLD